MVLINMETVPAGLTSHRDRHPGHGIGESSLNRVVVYMLVIHHPLEIFKSAKLGLTSYLFITCDFPQTPHTVRIKKERYRILKIE